MKLREPEQFLEKFEDMELPPEATEKDVDKFMEDNSELMDDLAGNPSLPEKFEDAVPEYTKKERYAPEDLAATFFKMQAPKLSRLLHEMSAKQLRRIIFNVVSFPLIDTKYAPKVQEEKDAVYLMTEMMFNKSIMQLTIEMQKAEAAMLKQETNPEENVSIAKPALEELIEKELTKEKV